MNAIEKDFLETLNEFKQLGIENSINYEKMNEILISHHSTAIEGSTLSLDEVIVFLNEDISPKGKKIEELNMVKDHQNALEWIIENAKNKEKITPLFIKELSSKVMKNTGSRISSVAGDFDSSKGDYRKVSVMIGQRYFTSYQKIEREVDYLCDEINSRNKENLPIIDIYKLAFDAHYKLVSIHPFVDGNGRTSRLLMNYILAQHKQPLSIIYNDDKLEYYRAIEECRNNKDENLSLIHNFMFSQEIKFFKTQISNFKEAENMTIIPKKKGEEL